MRLTVIGLGLIGGSLSLDLKSRGFATEITGVDASNENRKLALKLGLVDRVLPLEKALLESDLVILAIPVDSATELLPQVLSSVSKSTTVTDMGSTKLRISKAVEKHPARAQFVASHPMAGTENSGPQAALSGLFDSKTAVICDEASSGKEHLSRVETMYAALKMRVIRMSSAEHDRHAAFVSHLSHISSFVLANTVLAEESNAATIFDLAGGGFESTVRLAKSSPAMWSPIFEQNHENVLEAVESYLAHLEAFRDALASKSRDRSRVLMEDANRIRRVLQKMEMFRK